jgi:hypothetical protein
MATDLSQATELQGARARRGARRVGVAATGCSLLFLVAGAGRGFDLDSSITAHMFVTTPSLLDPFQRAFVFNNHVLFSFLDHVVFSVTGSRSGTVLRALPIAIAASAVGVFAAVLTRRFGTLAGLAGAALLTTNPLFADIGTQLRGYGLVVLCAIVTTALLGDALATGSMSTGARVAYALFSAVGVATHLYMLLVVLVHVVASLSNRAVAARWVTPWLAAGLGGAAYVSVWDDMRTAARVSGHQFRATFPRDLTVAIMGGSVLAALLVAAVAVPSLWERRRDRVVRLAGIAIAVAVAVPWLVAPFDLYPRFFAWLVPLAAAGAAATVAKRPRAIAVVGLAVVIQTSTAWPRLTTDEVPNRQAAGILTAAIERGGLPCVSDDFTALRTLGYTDRFVKVPAGAPLPNCTVLIAYGVDRDGELARAARRKFPYSTTLEARTDGVLWSAIPADCWTVPGALDESRCAIPDWI